MTYLQPLSQHAAATVLDLANLPLRMERDNSETPLAHGQDAAHVLVALTQFGADCDELDQFLARTPDSVNVAVSNNGPREKITPHGASFVVNNLHNPGYYPGCFDAARQLLNEFDSDDVEWILLCNFDLEIPWPELLSALSEHAADRPIAFTPQIRDMPSAHLRNPNMETRPSKWRLRRVHWSTQSALLFRLQNMLSALKQRIRHQRGAHSVDPIPLMPRAIYSAHGSFIAMSRPLFELTWEAGMNVPLFAEEVWLAEVTRQLGAPIVLDERITVTHHAHATISTLDPATRRQHWAAGTRASLAFFSEEITL